MRVLVTGSGGYIGGVLVRRLLARGQEVVALVHRSDPAREHPGLRVVHADILDRARLADIIGPVEGICHLAGLRGVRQSGADPRRYFEVNVGGTVNLLEAAAGPSCRIVNWVPALSDGVELASGRPVVNPPFDLVFYGNVFLPPVAAGTMGSPSSDGGLAGLSDDEVADLAEVAAEAVTPEELAAAAALPPTMGHTRVPKALQVVLRALDAKFGAAAGVLYLGKLRQVRSYLRFPKLKAEIDGIVERAVTPECRILIGHSLGSVVAAEFLRLHPAHHVDLFLTVGSPLGLRMVQSCLPVPMSGAGIPPTVRRWVNVRDPRDPVTCAGDLSWLWPGVEDRHVDNGGDAHNVARYLSKIQTGSAILDAAPRFGALEVP